MQDKNSKELFHSSLWAAVPLFVYIAITLASSVIVAGIWVLSGHVTASSGASLADIQTMIVEQMNADYAWLNFAALITEYVLMIPVFGFMMLKDQKKLLLEGRIKKANPIPGVWFLLIVATGIAFCISGSNLITLSGLAEESTAYQQTETILTSASIPVQIVVIGVMAPIAEELLFRGLIYKRFRISQPHVMAVLWSALVFALLHGNMVQGIYAFVLGIVLCFVYYRYGTILAPILLHVSINLTSVFADQFVTSYPGLGIFFGVTFVGFGVIIFCLYLEELHVRPLAEDVVVKTTTGQ